MSQPYLSLEALLHDAFWAAADDGSEVRLIADFLDRHPGPALEVGCGSGRLLMPLLQSGREVEGLELSPDMLALAHATAARLGLTAKLHPGDMNHWQPARRFASILAPAFTLQLSADPIATLQHWHRWLAPGGGLYLTIFTPLAELAGDLPENEWYEDHRTTLPDGRDALLKTRHSLDEENRLLLRDHHYTLEGPEPQTHSSRQSLRWFEPGELEWLLESAGFAIDAVLADFHPQPAPAGIDAWNGDGILTYHARSIA